jgi:MYXO-CTERM domain-containing protein
MTADDLSRRENWPNDPGYAGQWEHWSWIPGANLMVPNFRRAEIPLGAGNNVDRAWGITIGDPRVLIAVLDSGIRWSDEDLINKVALNTGELPMPMGALSHDGNGDGVVNMLDYVNDPRLPCGTGMGMRDPRRCLGTDGRPNDPNRNGVLDAGDLLRVFSDDTDGDNNGYKDDIAGWDFFHDDNDAFDDTDFGHGTGEARWSAAEGNNGRGDIGACPRCMFVPVRVGDSFITQSNDFAQGVVYAVDRGVSVVQEALGTLDNSTYAQRAIDYAYAHDAIVVASAADENSRHHNVPGTNNHTLYVHAIRYDRPSINASTTFLNFNNCTNYGAQLVLSVSGTGCSSEATGQSSGMAGLLYSEALQSNLRPALSAEEARQLLVMTADDIDVPESRPGHPMYDEEKYPSLPGWDQRFGYGRTNARRAVEALRDRRIPPEVDITSPRWFTPLNPAREGERTLRIEGRIAARRAPRFDYVVEWAPGIEPDERAWRMLRTEQNVTAPVTDRLAELNLADVRIDNPGERENRYTLTVRVRVTARYEAPVGDVRGEQRRVFYVHRDDTVLPAFPRYLGASIEASPHLVDLDRAGPREVVVADTDGAVHAFRADGTELPGFPVRTLPIPGLRAMAEPSYRGAAAYRGPMAAINPDNVREAIVATPAIGDLDGDLDLEVVANSYDGTVYVWNHDGTPYGRGFPFTLPEVTSAMTSRRAVLQRGLFGSPVLYDLNGDNRLEVIFGAMDGKVYALDAMTGRNIPGFPVLVHFPDPPGTPEAMQTEHNRIFGSVGVGDLDGDRRPDIVSVSSERLAGDPNTGAIYAIYADGMNHPGGPYHPNWPLAFNSFSFFPLVAEGITTSPALADIDGDGRDELSLTGTGLPTILLARGVQPRHAPRPTFSEIQSQAQILSNGRGPLSDFEGSTVAFANVFSIGAFGDLDGDGRPDYTTSGAELNLAINLGGGGIARPFFHLVGAWNGTTGRVFPGFPRVIEDYTFFMNPAIADVSRDAYAEVILGTGGYYLRAFDACGREPQGWPKFTGQWIISSPSVGDLDGDHTLEVVTATRGGYLWAWRTAGDDRTSSIQWEGFRHDARNTGNYGTALSQGVRRVMDAPTIECPVTTTDGGTRASDGGAGSTPQDASGGCGCRAAGRQRDGVWALLGVALALGARRRRRG